MTRLAYHETLGVLDAGDLHPGGAEATAFLLDELEKAHPRRVLEVGAGIGRTTDRMLARGWEVVALEPNPVLRACFSARHPAPARPERLEHFAHPGPAFDAAIGESVFYAMDLPAAFARLHDLLRPGGLLAFVDLVWTDRGDHALAARVHDATRAIFGIPMTSRQRLTWTDWRRALEDAGFVAVAERQVGTSARASVRVGLSRVVRHPATFASYLRYALFAPHVDIPEGTVESRMAVWRRA